MTDAPHILIVDDHREIRDALKRYLEKNGLRASVADGGAAMDAVLRTAAIDLVVLDVMMPGEDGLTICRRLRATTELPILMLTALSEETDRIVGLEMGADDYLAKPFNPRELLARVRAILRRAEKPLRSGGSLAGRRVRFDRWILDMDSRELTADDGTAAVLTSAEFRLLTVFLERPRFVLSRDQLLDLTSGRAAHVFDRTIDNQVSRLRRKIERDPQKPALVTTVWGGGYTFAADVAEVP